MGGVPDPKIKARAKKNFSNLVGHEWWDLERPRPKFEGLGYGVTGSSTHKHRRKERLMETGRRNQRIRKRNKKRKRIATVGSVNRAYKPKG